MINWTVEGLLSLSSPLLWDGMVYVRSPEGAITSVIDSPRSRTKVRALR